MKDSFVRSLENAPPLLTPIQRAYQDGHALFSSHAQFRASKNSPNYVRSIRSAFHNETPYDSWKIPLDDSAPIENLMPMTYEGFMISARWDDLVQDGVRVKPFLNDTQSHPLSKGARPNMQQSQEAKLADPSIPLTAFRHARTVLGLLQSKAVLGNTTFELMLEELGIYSPDMAGQNPQDVDFYTTLFSETAPDPHTYLRATWAGNGSGESVVMEIRRLATLIDTALRRPSELRNDQVLKGLQFFTLGNRLFDIVSAGQNLVLQEDLASEIEEYLQTSTILGE